MPFAVAGRRVVVVGAARSGIAAARLLAARGASVVLTDLRPAIEERGALEAQGVRIEAGAHEPATLAAADLIVLSPGVSPWQAILDGPRAAGVEIIGELELASRWFAGRVVAITGTKGKSTTTTLVGEMLRAGGVKALVGGNLGPAASLQVPETAADVVHVVEASSFQLEVAPTFRPDIAVFLNFSPDHLDRHRSVEAYAAAKGRIFANQRERDLAIVNAGDPAVMRLAATTRARRVPFAVGTVPARGVGIRDGVIVSEIPEQRRAPGIASVDASAGGNRPEEASAETEPRPLVPVASVRLLGTHLLADVVAAAAVADACGVPAAAMTRAVEGFGGLEHALEVVGTAGGVRFVNDSKATNVEAARQALEAFESGVVAIMGGRFKGGDLGQLAGPLRSRARAVVAIGESRARFREALAGVLPIVEAATLREAVDEAWRLAGPGGTVLLSPACASFDMFRDYAERGNAFKEEVARLRAAHGA